MQFSHKSELNLESTHIKRGLTTVDRNAIKILESVKNIACGFSYKLLAWKSKYNELSSLNASD